MTAADEASARRRTDAYQQIATFALGKYNLCRRHSVKPGQLKIHPDPKCPRSVQATAV